MFKKFYLIKCNCVLEQMVENRALELGITIPEYFKYLAIKDIENTELKRIPEFQVNMMNGRSNNKR